MSGPLNDSKRRALGRGLGDDVLGRNAHGLCDRNIET
jgi:hypothetical protein